MSCDAYHIAVLKYVEKIILLLAILEQYNHGYSKHIQADHVDITQELDIEAKSLFPTQLAGPESMG